MTNHTQTAVVVGGSLTGLMTGIVLKSKGYKVRVLERSASQALESTAAGIRAGPEVYGFIEQYVRNVPDYAIPVRTVEVMDNLGAFIQNVPLQDILQLSTWKILHDLLKGALLDDEDGNPVATYHTRQLVQSVEKAGENFQLDVLDLEKDTSTTFESDLVIAADGAHSAIRNKLCPGTSPQYAGYVTWRGRIPEEAMSAEAREALQNRCVILRVDGGYQVSYYVPADGDPDYKKRDFVWIWYDTLPGDTPEFTETLTDVDGKSHFTTIPRGKMRPDVWQRVLSRKASVINPYFMELMEKIEQPFVSAIRDFKGTKSVFYDGKLLLAGDAFTVCRPHGAGSTSQAAFQVQTLIKVLDGEMTLEQWEETCLEAAAKAAQYSMGMARFFWTGKVPGT